LQRLPAVELRLLSRELLGLEHLHRDARPVHDSVPAVRALPAVDLDLRGQGSAGARARGGGPWLTGCSDILGNSPRPSGCSTPSARRATRASAALTRSVPSRSRAWRKRWR